MNGQSMSYLLVVCVVVALAMGQVLFKILGIRLATSFSALWSEPSTFGIFCIALTVYGLATLAWIAALRALPLSHAYTFTALGFVIVPIASHFVFGEALTIRLAIGTVMIIAGILVVAT